jgi:hypothetical protein
MTSNKIHHIHTDPSRCPKLQLPIEEVMINNHTLQVRKMMVDITKELVKQKK